MYLGMVEDVLEVVLPKLVSSVSGEASKKRCVFEYKYSIKFNYLFIFNTKLDDEVLLFLVIMIFLIHIVPH
jgi:hypothetical protein